MNVTRVHARMVQTTALVTGASRGLGLALVRELLLLAPDGPSSMRVLLSARTPEAAHGAAAALRQAGLQHVTGCDLDVSSARSIASFAREHEDIDLLINNAAVCPSGWTIGSTRSCWRTNVLGPMLLTRALLPGMVRRRRGHVVHVSSGDGELAYLNTALQEQLRAADTEFGVLRLLARASPPRNAFGESPAYGETPAYSSSKAALNALARIAASRLPCPSECGVRVSAVCPGDVRTRMLAEAMALSGEAMEMEARRRVLPPHIAARDVLNIAVAGLDGAQAGLPSGRFWRHAQQLEF